MPKFRTLDVEPFSSSIYGLEMETERSERLDKKKSNYSSLKSEKFHYLFSAALRHRKMVQTKDATH